MRTIVITSYSIHYTKLYEVHVAPEASEPRTYDVPVGKHMRVHAGDKVRAGDRLSEGPT